jgi:hypothetical protein
VKPKQINKAIIKTNEREELRMVTNAIIDDFISQRSVAIVWVLRKANKFGDSAIKELKNKLSDFLAK